MDLRSSPSLPAVSATDVHACRVSTTQMCMPAELLPPRLLMSQTPAEQPGEICPVCIQQCLVFIVQCLVCSAAECLVQSGQCIVCTSHC